MSKNGSHNGSSQPKSGGDAITRMREVVDNALNQMDEASKRSKEAIREADLALRIGSRS